MLKGKLKGSRLMCLFHNCSKVYFKIQIKGQVLKVTEHTLCPMKSVGTAAAVDPLRANPNKVQMPMKSTEILGALTALHTSLILFISRVMLHFSCC